MHSLLFLMLTIGQVSYVANSPSAGSFPLVQGQQAASLYVDSADWPGVVRAAGDLQSDVERVTRRKPAITGDPRVVSRNMVIIGTIGKSPVVCLLYTSDAADER